jgi:hypothetical protein
MGCQQQRASTNARQTRLQRTNGQSRSVVQIAARGRHDTVRRTTCLPRTGRQGREQRDGGAVDDQTIRGPRAVVDRDVHVSRASRAVALTVMPNGRLRRELAVGSRCASDSRVNGAWWRDGSGERGRRAWTLRWRTNRPVPRPTATAARSWWAEMRCCVTAPRSAVVSRPANALPACAFGECDSRHSPSRSGPARAPRSGATSVDDMRADGAGRAPRGPCSSPFTLPATLPRPPPRRPPWPTPPQHALTPLPLPPRLPQAPACPRPLHPPPLAPASPVRPPPR